MKLKMKHWLKKKDVNKQKLVMIYMWIFYRKKFEIVICWDEKAMKSEE